ncbi:MAG: transaldolase family protein [Cyanobacteriota bacterium]|nr:transaldolase family protein [Cyanobacteriota bacterium]
MTPRLLLDSADQEAWASLWPLGLFQGITTNPTLLRRAGVSCDREALMRLVHAARAMDCQELHLQAWGGTEADLLACGQDLLALAPELVVVKLPLTDPGLRAARRLLRSGERVTLTACYSIPQVIASSALGATYVAPYLGRISDDGRDGCGDVITMGRCLHALGSTTRLLVASLRSLAELTRLAAEGVDTFTLSPQLAQQLWSHSASEAAAAQFEQDARAAIPGDQGRTSG